MEETMKSIISLWEERFKKEYGGELEIDYIVPEENENIKEGYYACAYDSTPKEGFDGTVKIIKEIECLGQEDSIECICRKLGVPVLR